MKRQGLYIGLYILITLVAIGLIYMYRSYNPMHYSWFPKCPLKSATGLECAGCGSQRALHFLLNGELKQAFHQNALLLPFIPYLTLGYFIQFNKEPSTTVIRWRKILYGSVAIKVIAILLFAYTIYRNWPH